MYNYEETLERIIPEKISKADEFAQKTLQLHLQRYEFALQNLIAGNVLDIACGTGYGTALIAKGSATSTVTGVDIDDGTILYARHTHKARNIFFINSSLFAFSSLAPFNTIVCLETIEHIVEPEKVVGHLLQLLASNGRLIISAPITPSMDGNPYHVNDFSEQSFKKLFISRGLSITNQLLQVQPYQLADIIGSKKVKRIQNTRRNLALFYFKHPIKLIARLRSLVFDGLNNKYLTLVVQKSGEA